LIMKSAGQTLDLARRMAKCYRSITPLPNYSRIIGMFCQPIID